MRTIALTLRKIMESNLFNVEEMNVNQLRDVVKMMMRLLNFETDRLTHLQDRVLQLELKQLNEEKECDHLWSVDLNGRHPYSMHEMYGAPKVDNRQGKG